MRVALAALIAWGVLFAWTASAHADPITSFIALAVTNAALNAGFGAAAWAIGSAVGAIGTVALSVGLSIGASALQGVLTKKSQQERAVTAQGETPQPTAQDVQQTVKQSVATRRRHYGVNLKVGGVLAFFHSHDGRLFILVMIAHGEIASIATHWLNDAPVTLDGSGFVQEGQYSWNATFRVQIKPQLGTADQAAHAELIAAFPDMWTSAHRLRGIANVLLMCKDVPPDVFTDVYPAGPPQYRAEITGAKVYDVRNGGQSAVNPATWAVSDNPALCILDFLTHADGMGRPRSMFNTLAFHQAANDCDDLIPLAAGGAEKRYRLSGSYDLSERPADVLQRMLAVCDGEIYPTADGAGTYGLRVGKWVAPTVTIDADDVLRFNFEQGSNALATFNIVKPIYVSPLHDYQETQAEDWRDETAIAAMGEERAEELRLGMCTSHGQARRLAKIAMAKGNPLWRGTLITNINGLRVLGERFITLNLPLLEIESQTFRVDAFKLAGDLSSCEIAVSSFSADAYSWNAAAEEGTAAPAPPAFPATQVIGVPEDFAVVPAGENIPSASWTLPARDTISHEIQHRFSPSGGWTTVPIDPGIGTWQPAGSVGYGIMDVRLRARSPGGKYSEFAGPITVDTITPIAATDLTTSVVAGDDVLIEWHNSVSPGLDHTWVYYNTVADFNSATVIHTVAGAPDTDQDYTHVDRPTGTHHYWVVSFNISNLFATTGPASQAV